jgi:peptidoglycan/xylan/chitin deacetylase (PgdA/CDA1 family)
MSDSRFNVSLTFDPDGCSIWAGTFQTRNPSMLSRGEYGPNVGVPRVLDLLRRKGITASFFIPGHTVCAFPDRMKEIRDAGHEIGHHGVFHENPASFDRDGEREILERGIHILDTVLGVRPVGYRSPAWDLSPNSIGLLKDAGFLYDTSCMAQDFEPYYLRVGDRWSPTTMMEFGEVSDFVEMPVTWLLDDFIVFEHIWGSQEGLRRPRDVEELWREEFDYGYANCPGGSMTLTMHPQVIGRGSRMTMLERLLDYMAGHDGVTFHPLGEVASAWKKNNDVRTWAAANPTLTGVNAITDL